MPAMLYVTKLRFTANKPIGENYRSQSGECPQAFTHFAPDCIPELVGTKARYGSWHEKTKKVCDLMLLVCPDDADARALEEKWMYGCYDAEG